MSKNEIPGPERAAILLMSLGEAEAAEVLKHMGAKDVQKVGQAMATLTNVSRERATEVLESFVAELDTQTSLGVGADEVSSAGGDSGGPEFVDGKVAFDKGSRRINVVPAVGDASKN